jgi:hypothetical protein
MKIVSILFFCLCTLNLAIGQSDSTSIQNPIPTPAPPAKAFNIGIQISSASSWLSTNDNTIDGDGDLLGLRFGLILEKYFQENYAIMSSFSFLTNQGGTLHHENGGNLLPKSNLSSSSLNTGQKPLPDDTRITYHANYLEFALGLKLKTNSIGKQRSLRIYAELPTVAAALAVKSRGDIKAAGIDTEDEEIRKDVANFYLSWGLGGGVELTLKNGLALFAGISYQQSLTDITRDKGNKAFELIDDMGTPDPTDDQYNTEDEKARALLNGLTIRAGIFF